MSRAAIAKVCHLQQQYPLIRGMVSYGVIWPASSLTQDYIQHGTTIYKSNWDKANWSRAIRFGIFGAFCMSPMIYAWMRFSDRFFLTKTFLTALKRAAFEQVTYAPVAVAYFYFGMSLLERKPLEACVAEVEQKFWPTYKICVIFWPTVQTINFYMVAEKNRVVFTSLASYVWTVFMAHMKEQTVNKQ